MVAVASIRCGLRRSWSKPVTVLEPGDCGDKLQARVPRTTPPPPPSLVFALRSYDSLLTHRGQMTPGTLCTPSHFTVLALPEPTASSSSVSPKEVKVAYKRALLLHHPDKSSRTMPRPKSTKFIPTVDQITLASRTLVTPNSQHAYVQHLIATRHQPQFQHSILSDPSNQEGVEHVDLDNMQYDAEAQTYHRSCRCGRKKSYVVSEVQLEERAENREVMVGCEGCSLWICVEFGLVEEDGAR